MTGFCSTCEKMLRRGNKTGLCAGCLLDKRRVPAHYCACGAITSRRANRCRPCGMARLNGDPQIKAKRIAGVKRAANDPATKADRVERARRANATKRKNPAYMAFLRHQIRRIQPLSCTPEALTRRDHVKRGQTLSDTRLPWCPREYRALHRWHIYTKRMTSAQSREIIEAKIREDQGNMTFEDKLRAVAEGKLSTYTVPTRQDWRSV